MIKTTEETYFETFVRMLCKNCKNRYKCKEELRRRIDNSMKCYKYVKDKDLEGYKQQLKVTAKKKKPIMKNILK